MDLTWGEIQTILGVAVRAIKHNILQHEVTGFDYPVCAKDAAIRVEEAYDLITSVCEEEYDEV